MIRLELLHSTAQRVSVAGTFNGWNPDMQLLDALGDGRWAIELRLKPGRYEYRFIVDGQWISDPDAFDYVPNPHHSFNSVLAVEQG